MPMEFGSDFGFISLESSFLWCLQTFKTMSWRLSYSSSSLNLPMVQKLPQFDVPWPLSADLPSFRFPSAFFSLYCEPFHHDFSIFQSAWLYSSGSHYRFPSTFSGMWKTIVEGIGDTSPTSITITLRHECVQAFAKKNPYDFQCLPSWLSVSSRMHYVKSNLNSS